MQLSFLSSFTILPSNFILRIKGLRNATNTFYVRILHGNHFILRIKGLRNATDVRVNAKLEEKWNFILRIKGLRNATLGLRPGEARLIELFHTQNKGIQECNKSAGP